jgi:hypothetical protein
LKDKVCYFPSLEELKAARTIGKELVCLQPAVSDKFVYNEISFPRELIDEGKKILQPYYENELSDKVCAEALYKIAKLEILLREIKERNDDGKAMTPTT